MYFPITLRFRLRRYWPRSNAMPITKRSSSLAATALCIPARSGTTAPNGWDRIEDLSYGDGFKVQPGSPITAIKRDDRQVDIFVVGREQTVGQRDSPVFTNWMDQEADPEHPHWNRWLRLEDPG